MRRLEVFSLFLSVFFVTVSFSANNSIQVTRNYDDDSLIPPVLVSKNRLKYSQLMLKNEAEGEVRIKLLITAKGRVDSCIFINDLGYDSRKQILRAVKRYRFKPAQKKGKPVSVWTTLPIRFELISDTAKVVRFSFLGIGILIGWLVFAFVF